MATTEPILIQVQKSTTDKRTHEFMLREALVASLQFVSAWREDAVLRINGQTWQVKRTGFWKRQIEFKADQSPYTKLNIPCNWKYTINYRLSHGARYLFKTTGFWKRTWGWYDEQEQMVMSMKTSTSFNKRRGEVVLYKTPTEEFFLLMLLGWYQLVIYQRHVAASAAA